MEAVSGRIHHRCTMVLLRISRLPSLLQTHPVRNQLQSKYLRRFLPQSVLPGHIGHVIRLLDEKEKNDLEEEKIFHEKIKPVIKKSEELLGSDMFYTLVKLIEKYSETRQIVTIYIIRIMLERLHKYMMKLQIKYLMLL